MGYTTGFQKYKKRYGKKSMGSYLRFLNKRKPKRVAKPKVSFAKRVNALISSKIENKFSNNFQVSGNVLTWATGSSPVWFRESLIAPMSMTQGTSSWNRIGNSITLKKWIVKVLVHPALDNDPYAST